MFWPVYYAAILLPFILLRNSFYRTGAVFVALALFCIQIVDLYPHFKRVGGTGFSRWASPLQSPVWTKLIEGKKHIAFVPSRRINDDYIPFAHLALENGLDFNTGYFARLDRGLSRGKRFEIEEKWESGMLDSATLYILRNEEYLSPTAVEGYVAGIWDGFPFVSPGSEMESGGIRPWPRSKE